MVSYRRGIGQPDWHGTPIGTLLPSQMLTFFPQPIFLKFALILRPLHIDSIGLISLGRKSEGGGKEMERNGAGGINAGWRR
jgi:hypothetical protein